jgi:RNA polymerase sigma factor (sigma-70 family)
MPEPDDIALLKQHVEGDESAFTTLFERHVHLVYSAAVRQARNPSHAEEITQAVFILLARKAKSLNSKIVLSGWLYQATRLTTASLIKREARRQRREQEVYMQTLTEPETPLWEQISPLLEDAMGRLSEQDRNAIVLRFFENKTPQEVAMRLKLNEVTARKRVSRALERLRKFFAKRGVVLTTAILAGLISSNSVQAAPATLTNTGAALAIAKGAPVSASTLTLVNAVLKAITMQKIKVIAVVGVAALFAAGTTTLAVEKSAQPNSSVPYRMADDIYRLVDSVDTNRLFIFLTIFSANKDVHPGDICFTIHSAIKGPILYRPSTNGILTATNFPDDAALRRENPIVMANQPFNSMLIIPMFLLTFPEERTFNCSVLTGDIDEARRAFAKLNEIVTPGNVGWTGYIQWLLMPTPRVDGVAFVFPRSDANKATVKIQTPANTWTYRADGTGVITLELDNKSLPENAQISLSERPLSIGLNYSLHKTALSPFSISVDMGQQTGQ